MEREALHTRRTEACGYRRADGLFEIEAELIDVKHHARTSGGVTRQAGEPIHGMSLCFTVNAAYAIVDVREKARHLPYAGACAAAWPGYRRLIGLTLAPGFMRAVRERLGGRSATLGLAGGRSGQPGVRLRHIGGHAIACHAAAARLKAVRQDVATPSMAPRRDRVLAM